MSDGCASPGARPPAAGRPCYSAVVARLGACRVPVYARGLGGVLLRKRVGGNEAVHVVIKDARGRQKSFIVSSYDKCDEIVAKISERVGKPFEKMETGLFGMKWPDSAAVEISR